MNKTDIVILTLGSMMSGVSEGSNTEPPPSISVLPEDWQSGDWSPWFKLASRSSKFGAPSNFCPRTGRVKFGNLYSNTKRLGIFSPPQRNHTG